MTRFPAVGGGGGEQPIASKDRAETFEESDVSLYTSNSEVANESVKLTEADGTEATRDADNTTRSATDRRGVFFSPNTDMEGVAVTLSSNSDGSTKGYLVEGDGSVSGTILDEVDISGLSGGDVWTAYGSLTAGNTYRAVVDDDGNSFVDGENDSLAYPFESTDLDLTNGAYGGGDNTSRAWSVRSVQAVFKNMSGSVTVEWPGPTDIYRWDAATFQRSEDGETVEVYIEEDDGSGWTEIAGPISRGDQIDADPDSQVRFRVELARNDVTNNPTLDAIYRRWVV